jgi:predicted ATPase/DNA-binding SARP family transcriptional activator
MAAHPAAAVASRRVAVNAGLAQPGTVGVPARYLAGVEIRILGPLEVVGDDGVLPLGGRRERALLAVLSLSPGQALSSDRLIDALWGESLPSNPTNALQALVSRLRRTIGAETVVTQAPGYTLDVAPEAVDAHRFRAMVDTAREEVDPAVQSRLLGEALALWRGPALGDFSLEEFAQREAAVLEELRLTAIESRIAADLECGAGADLVPELEELVAAHPLREGLRASQMLALYRAGRQADALRAYTSARQVLGEELGIEPGPELRAMEESILMQDPSLQRPETTHVVPPSRSLLPARVASFVGREAEMAEVAATFKTSRLVTLTGSGGAGKTSLAIEVGRSLEAEYSGGVWLVELAPVVDPARVADALVSALHLEQVVGIGGGRGDVDEIGTVVEYLRSRRALLIVDNCEHVIDASAAVAEAILLACPGVEVLATSRDRLGIPGEVLWRVPSLSTDGAAAAAIQLFVERAQAVNPGFVPTSAEIDQIEDVCVKLDGLPLAIELAAARVRLLPLAEIARRLDSGISILSGGPRQAVHRQQTLRAAIDWSYQLLAPEEADLLTSLSVFHGSFALEGAEAAASPRVTDVLASLERLIDSSMVTPAGSGGRYRILETLRVYAGEKLAEAGDFDNTMARLLGHYLTAMESAQEGLQGSEQLEWLDRIEAELDTMRSVLGWATTHAPDSGLELAGMLGWFWYLRGSAAEAQERFSALLAAAGEDADVRRRGDAYFFHSLCGPAPEQVRSGFEEAREAYAEAGYVPGLVNAQAMVAAWGFEMAETIALLDDAAQIAIDAGYEWGVALIRFLQAGVASVGNDHQAAIRLADEATTRFAALGDSWGQGYSLYSGGSALRAMGEYERAEEAFRAALEHARPMRLRREMAPVMSELASVATMTGDYAAADSWLDEAQRYADEVPFAGSQGMVRNARGKLARLRGDLEEAIRLHQHAVELYTRADHHGGLAYSYSCLGIATCAAGELDVASSHFLAALSHAESTGDTFAIALALEGMGILLVARGDTIRGVELISAGLTTRQQAGAPLPSGERPDVDQALATAAAAMGPAALEPALEAGRHLGLDAAIEVATAV